MDIKLDSDALATVASAAIWDHISEEQRGEILKQAIQYLLTPKESHGFGARKTPLQMAFEQALHTAAFKAVQEKVASDPQVHAYIQELLGPLVDSTVRAEATQYRTELVDRIGAALAAWLAEKAKSD